MNDTKKTNWLYLYYALLALALFLLAGVNSYFKVMPERVSMALVSLGIAAVLFGIFDSVAKVAVGEESKLGKTFSLGGAAAGFYIVFQLLTAGDVSQPKVDEPEPAVFDLVFTAPLNKEPAISHFDPDRLLVHQRLPTSTYKDHPIVPSRLIGSRIGYYELKERRIKQPGDKFDARVKREVLSSFIGQLDDIPQFDLCFHYESVGPVEASFECDTASCRIAPLSKNIAACTPATADSSWQLFRQAYANDNAMGWITPSLATLKENFDSKQHTYVEFSIRADDLKLPPKVDSYSYQLEVNQQPVFIDGWTEAETTTGLDPAQPFTLNFGLQNLDFSGADFGREQLQLRLTFYSDGDVVRTDIIQRHYVALRTVHTISDVVNDVLYTWSGQQHFGKSDGFEVFIWSSSDAAELVERRKKFFDDANLIYQGGKVVAVVRPPLSQNPNYGLVLGLMDGAGRIDFTFPKSTAVEIASWLRQDVAPLKTAIRPETNQQHRLIKDVNLYQIGH